MKKIIFMLCLAVVSWGANAQHDHSQMDNKSTIPTSIQVENSQSVTAVIDNYLALKNALVADNGKLAASSGQMLYDALAKFDISTKSTAQQKELGEIIDDAKENAEHISENGGDIEHQREHFVLLSKDIKDLIVIAGTDRTLYQMFCPMYNNNEGGMWLSESKEIKNPLFGSKMLKCGSVQQEISVK